MGRSITPRSRRTDTSAVTLYRFLETNGLEEFFPEYQSYDIRVDVTGIVQTKLKAHIVFVECKLKQITLRDLSQLLGYSRVAIPIYSIIISPAGIGSAMTCLLKTYGRIDVLEYEKDRRLKVATWDVGSFYRTSLLDTPPPGALGCRPW